jgi:hypothetical protein
MRMRTAAASTGAPRRLRSFDPARPTTMRYDRARGSLDRHATYIVVAGYVAATAR